MNILYIVFGEKLSYHLEAYLSIRTFQKQLTAQDRIFVLTTNPDYYRRAQVEILPISQEQIEAWKGSHHFFFRVKIMALDYLCQRYPQEHLLYLDSDTFLYGSLDALRQRLEQGQGLMHIHEGHPSAMRGASLRMWKLVGGRCYGGVTLDEHHDMWNAGVVGIPAMKTRQVIDTSLALCDGMLDDGANAFILEQYASSVSMAEHTRLCAAADHIGHFWGNKPEWEQLSADLLLRSYMKNGSIDDELHLITDELLHSTPVYVHRSSTARRLHGLVDKWFPDRDARYL